MKRISVRLMVLPILVALMLFSLSASTTVSQTGGTTGPAEPQNVDGEGPDPSNPGGGSDGPATPEGGNDKPPS